MRSLRRAAERRDGSAPDLSAEPEAKHASIAHMCLHFILAAQNNHPDAKPETGNTDERKKHCDIQYVLHAGTMLWQLEFSYCIGQGRSFDVG